MVEEVANQLGTKAEYEYLSLGSFNCCYRLKGLHSIIRFPIFGKSAFRYEKTNDECMIMKYVSRHTSIAIPELLRVESRELGPYMVLSFVDGTRLSDHLKVPSATGSSIVLQPDINKELLARAYRNMATVLIELSGCKFARIGAVGQDELGNWCVRKRAITLNMNQFVSSGNYPPHGLLLKHPDDWTDGDLGNFLETYLLRHKLFIQALQDEENEMIKRGDLLEGQRLSVGMAQSLENGHFWFCLAATSSYGFDDIY